MVGIEIIHNFHENGKRSEEVLLTKTIKGVGYKMKISSAILGLNRVYVFSLIMMLMV